MEVVTFVIGLVIGGTIVELWKNRHPDIKFIEKNLSESYRGETFERRAKRASK